MKCPTSTGVHARPTMYQEGVPRGAIIIFVICQVPSYSCAPPPPPHSSDVICWPILDLRIIHIACLVYVTCWLLWTSELLAGTDQPLGRCLQVPLPFDLALIITGLPGLPTVLIKSPTTHGSHAMDVYIRDIFIKSPRGAFEILDLF